MRVNEVGDEVTTVKGSMNKLEDTGKIVAKTGGAYWVVKLNVQ